MHIKIILTLFFAFLAKGGKTNQDYLVALGTVEGKSYFANGIREMNLTHFNWTASKSYCEEKGLKLATIHIEEEAKFLKSVYDPVDFNGWYWVAAQWTRGWSWIETGTRVVSGYSGVLYSNSDPADIELFEYCLCYSSNSHDAGYYFKRQCHHLHYVLCETYKPLENFSKFLLNHTKPEPKIIKIGTLNGTTYYGDKVLRNWTESQSFCLKNGMQLATIRSQAQGSFLRKTCFKINFDGHFWVLGREGGNLEPSPDQCTNYKPHHGSLGRSMCANKYFTLCESANSSTNGSFKAHPNNTEFYEFLDWNSVEDYEEKDLEEGIKEEMLREDELKEIAVCVYEKGSYTVVIIIVGIVVFAILVCLIWKTKLWARIFTPTVYFSVKQYPSGNSENKNYASGTELVIGD